MKNSSAHPGSTGILIGAVIAILALVRGPWQSRLLLGVFLIWGLGLLTAHKLPLARQANRTRKSWPHRKRYSAADDGPDIPARRQKTDSIPAETLLLRHVNHRISAYLRSAYPGVTWEWEQGEKPEKLALSGGTGRIRVFGVPDFGHADITLDQQANITCSMVRIVPLADTENKTTPDGQAPSGKQPADPQVWYEIQGRAILETLVTDLNSRGYSSLTIHGNGDACVEEDQKEVPKGRLPGFPEKVYWNRLVEVLESNGLTAEATPGGIRVCW